MSQLRQKFSSYDVVPFSFPNMLGKLYMPTFGKVKNQEGGREKTLGSGLDHLSEMLTRNEEIFSEACGPRGQAVSEQRKWLMTVELEPTK